MAYIIQLEMKVEYNLIIGLPGYLVFNDIFFMKPDACLGKFSGQKYSVPCIPDRILIRSTVQYLFSEILLQLFHLCLRDLTHEFFSDSDDAGTVHKAVCAHVDVAYRSIRISSLDLLKCITDLRADQNDIGAFAFGKLIE